MPCARTALRPLLALALLAAATSVPAAPDGQGVPPPPPGGAPGDTQAREPAPAAEPAPGMPAPDFELLDQDGTPVKLSELPGLVVLEWLNPGCPYVKHHYRVGTMKRLAQKYAEQGVTWLAIDSTHSATRDDCAAFRAAQELPYRILHDPSGRVGRAYGARTTPHMFVRGADGNLAYSGAIDDNPKPQGEAGTNYVDQALAALLSGSGVQVASTKPYGCSVKYAR